MAGRSLAPRHAGGRRRRPPARSGSWSSPARPGGWLPAGFELVPQRGGGLGERLEDAFSRFAGPSLLIGMDTPQVTPALLERALRTLSRPGVDAVLGAAEDGGFWAIGFAAPVPGAFAGVPMAAR